MNWLRSLAGKRNGMIPKGLLDMPRAEFKNKNSKRRYAGDVRRRERQKLGQDPAR